MMHFNVQKQLKKENSPPAHNSLHTSTMFEHLYDVQMYWSVISGFKNVVKDQNWELGAQTDETDETAIFSNYSTQALSPVFE